MAEIVEKSVPVPSLNVFTLTVACNGLIGSCCTEERNQLQRGLAPGRVGAGSGCVSESEGKCFAEVFS